MVVCDVVWMDCARICSANTLETLEVRNFDIGNCDDIMDRPTPKCIDFLFPIPNEKTGIHHFSRLKFLKLCYLSIDGWDENLDIDEKRMKTAFPKLEGLVLHNPTKGVSYALAN